LLGDGAVLVPPGDVGALDRAVQRLLDDSGARRLLADAGQTQAANWPTDNDTLNIVMEAYSDLLDRKADLLDSQADLVDSNVVEDGTSLSGRPTLAGECPPDVTSSPGDET
jgi:hypothetical protein